MCLGRCSNVEIRMGLTQTMNDDVGYKMIWIRSFVKKAIDVGLLLQKYCSNTSEAWRDIIWKIDRLKNTFTSMTSNENERV